MKLFNDVLYGPNRNCKLCKLFFFNEDSPTSKRDDQTWIQAWHAVLQASNQSSVCLWIKHFVQHVETVIEDICPKPVTVAVKELKRAATKPK